MLSAVRVLVPFADFHWLLVPGLFRANSPECLLLFLLKQSLCAHCSRVDLQDLPSHFTGEINHRQIYRLTRESILAEPVCSTKCHYKRRNPLGPIQKVQESVVVLDLFKFEPVNWSKCGLVIRSSGAGPQGSYNGHGRIH